MKKIVLMLLVGFSLAFSHSGGTDAYGCHTNSKTGDYHCHKSAEKLIDKEKISTQSINTQDVERSGCCSWHGGVSGCSGGRITCNDGTLSPSCTCNSSINPLG